MITTLVKHEDNYAIVIEQHMLDAIGATPDTRFEVFSNGQSLVFIPVPTSDRECRFREALERINTRFGGALKRLAE